MNFSCRLIPLIITATCLLSSPISTPAQPSTYKLSFADELFGERDYYRAITEYKRIIHQTRQGDAPINAQFMIGLSYYRAEMWDAARTAFEKLYTMNASDDILARALVLMGECAYRKRDYPSALDTFQNFVMTNPEDPRRLDATIRMIQCYILLDQPQFARDLSHGFSSIPGEVEKTEYIKAILNDPEQIPTKSPRLAGALSAFIPGAGQLYTGRRKDASLSFIL